MSAQTSNQENHEELCPYMTANVGGYDYVPGGSELRAVLDEILTDEYMQANTNFENFEAFRYSSAVIINWDADPLIYNRERMDAFVNESTRFTNWEEMIKDAADSFYK